VAATDHYSPTGQYGVNTAFNQSLAILGLAVAGQPIPQEAAQWLIGQQATEGDFAGSWDDGFGTAGNVDSTALALAALRVSGNTEDDPSIVAGLKFLEDAQLESGGWEYGTDFGENANSTAMAILALALLGEDTVSEDSRWVKDGVTPMAALLAWQGESGAFQADFGDGRSDDFFSTVQTVPALGFNLLMLGRDPLQAPVISEPVEMTPTAEEPTATSVPPTAEPPSAKPEATEEPPAAMPETVAEEQSAAETEVTEGNDAGENEAADPSAERDGDSGGSSVLPWIVVIGAVVVLVGLVWWAISRRQEA
jgi:hypothetical protein